MRLQKAQPRNQPRSGARMQPKAQAVGQQQQMIQPRRSERILSVSRKPTNSSECRPPSQAPSAATGATSALPSSSPESARETKIPHPDSQNIGDREGPTKTDRI